MEPLAILGACLAWLGMLSSGISNIANATDAYLNYGDQCLDYARRYARCQASLREWDMKWSKNPPIDQATGVAKVVPGLADIRALTSEIQRRVGEAENETAERQNLPVINGKRWTGRLQGLIGPLQGRWAKWRKGGSSTITKRAMHSLFKKGLMESWLTRLEKAIEDIEKSSEMTLRARTGANWAEGSSYARNKEAKEAEDFMSTLKTSAESLHRECMEDFSKGDWMLGLLSPQRHGSVAEWKYLRRLQNLGITIAQIVLAKPLRVIDHVSGTKFQEQDRSGEWKNVGPRQLVWEILIKSNSSGLADAIKFCLNDSEWERNGFREAYLMEFINSIYRP
ncbi:unnamed protein product [Alternaria alternata]